MPDAARQEGAERRADVETAGRDSGRLANPHVVQGHGHSRQDGRAHAADTYRLPKRPRQSPFHRDPDRLAGKDWAGPEEEPGHQDNDQDTEAEQYLFSMNGPSLFHHYR